ncbi:MAG: metal-sensing transcriptional repressor [Candidatus Colwellbacteria bacterium]|nr:metal-sensing transcriptional repressor [Candidatus Colwellbacteria bacterium]
MKKKSESAEKIVLNLKKARSSIDNVIRMLEEGRYCIDVMQQNLAVIGLLKSVHQMLMERHLNTCFRSAMVVGNEKKKGEMIDEVLKVTKLFTKELK